MHSFRMTLAECDQLSAGLYPGFAVLVSTTAMFRFLIGYIEVAIRDQKALAIAALASMYLFIRFRSPQHPGSAQRTVGGESDVAFCEKD